MTPSSQSACESGGPNPKARTTIPSHGNPTRYWLLAAQSGEVDAEDDVDAPWPEFEIRLRYVVETRDPAAVERAQRDALKRLPDQAGGEHDV